MMAVALVLACGDDSGLQRVEERDGERRIVGTLKNGKKHGQWRVLDARGRVTALETYRNGVLHGPRFTWSIEIPGFVTEQNLRYGYNHGRWRIFYNRSQIAELGRYYKGDYQGTWCSWEPDGRLEKVTEYRRGRMVREVDYPDWPCPTTQGAGRRHLDPENTEYE